MSGIVDQLHETDLFKDVDMGDLAILTERMITRIYQSEEVLFNEGDEGDAMYIITAGRIRIFLFDHGKEVTLKYYEINDIFGELSLLDHQPRSASAQADGEVQVLVLDRETFLAILDERPQIGLAMMRSLTQRLRYTTTYLEQQQPKRFEPAEESGLAEKLRSGEGDRVMSRIFDKAEAADTDDVNQRVRQSTQGIQFDEELSVPPPAEEKRVGGIFDRIASLQDEIDKEREEKGPRTTPPYSLPEDLFDTDDEVG